MDNQLNPLTLVAQMMSAAMDGALPKCERLIAQGVDMRGIADSHGQTPLHIAATNGSTDLCRLFLASGANPNYADEKGGTPLHLAAARGHLDVCRLLMGHGADLAATRGDDEYTPLHEAVIHNRKDVAGYFLDECNADGEQRSKLGHTLDEVAKNFGNYKLAEFLAMYRNSLKTGQAIRGALGLSEASAPASRSNKFSPL